MDKMFRTRKTKIICTIGPSSNTKEMVRKMYDKGMNIARLNFSHGTHEEHQKVMDLINEINQDLEVPLATMLDTKGPEIRIGKFKEPVMLQENDTVILTTEDIEWSDAKRISITYKKLPKIVEKGTLVYIADGTVELKVEEAEGNEIVCRVSIGGEINTKKNVNILGVAVDLPAISEQDYQDIQFAIRNNMQFIAQSFVKSAKDVRQLKVILKEGNAEHISVIAKIEAYQALQDIDEIIKESDGIMVARGDLGVQIPIENIPEVQKDIIKKCNMAGKPVITATQMLESMIKNPRPTRAEATDVANAILDGTDAIMLSGETASGRHPLRVIDTMDRIARKTEQTLKHSIIGTWVEEHDKEFKLTITDAISKSVCETARDLEASAIITCTSSGHTARQISRHKPITPIYSVTPNEREFRKLVLVWGVTPILIEYPENTDNLIDMSLDALKKKKFIETFDLVVITAGIPFNIAGNINLMKVELIK